MLILLLAILAGCGRSDDIERYVVARPQESGSARERPAATPDESVPGQLLGVIVPQGTTTWFFKLTGPIADVQPQMEPFLKFAQSIRFSDKGPEWSLPEGWKQSPGSSMRFATIRIPAEGEPLEMSVIPLPTAEGEWDGYLLSNVNRWREQLQLPPISKEELADKVVKIDLAGSPAWLVNYEGRVSKQGAMGGAPFAGRRPPRRESPPAETDRDSLPFTCTPPEGWQPAQANAMQLARFRIANGDQQAEISISSAGGDLAANVNRWREQIRLPPLEGNGLQKELHKVTVDDHDGILVDLLGPENDPKREALEGVIVEALGRQWFIKLRGDAELAGREKEHFQEFLQSIHFRGEK